MSSGTEPLVEIDRLNVTYRSGGSRIHALRDVSLTIDKRDTVGIVGESGSGKSTLLRAIVGLLPVGSEVTGDCLRYGDTELLGASELVMRTIRGREIATVFQDPVSALNPALTIGQQLGRVLRLRRPDIPRAKRAATAIDMLARVGVDAKHKLRAYPFQFSQGQLQRILIAATALAGRPTLLLADEPTTSLDVTIEAQVVELLRELRSELGLSLVLVTHDLALASELCERLVVMYGGRIVEVVDSAGCVDRARHPYTRELLRCIPDFPSTDRSLYSIPGEVSDVGRDEPGCPFAERCPRHIGSVCDTVLPAHSIGPREHESTLCHLYGPSIREHDDAIR